MEEDNDHIEQLENELTSLKRALEREKAGHRKFVDNALESEEILKREFAKQIQDLKKENVHLTKSNRQLTKDVQFYKQFVPDEEEPVDPATQLASHQASQAVKTRASSVQKEERAASSGTSKGRNRVGGKLYEENLKLRGKVSCLQGEKRVLKTKVKSLENFKANVKKKRTEYEQDLDELKMLTASRKKNKDTFNQAALAKLGEL